MYQSRALSDTKVKILMLGESGVGKSSILLRFADDKFQSGYVVTLGVEYKQKKQIINDKDVLVQVWDTAVYYKNVDGVVVVYDITDEHSYDSFTNILQLFYKVQIIEWEIQKIMRKFIFINFLKRDPKIVCVLVGNKCDMADKRVIPKERGQELATQFKNILEFTEASAKGDINIQQVFIKLTSEILKRREKGVGVQPENRESLSREQKGKKKSKCCGSGDSKPKKKK